MPTALVYKSARHQRLSRTRWADAAAPLPIVWIGFVLLVAALSLLAHSRALDPMANEGGSVAHLAAP